MPYPLANSIGEQQLLLYCRAPIFDSRYHHGEFLVSLAFKSLSHWRHTGGSSECPLPTLSGPSAAVPSVRFSPLARRTAPARVWLKAPNPAHNSVHECQ
jgi:hypothetical protein